MAELDIVIPVYNEGRNIVATLAALARADLERFNTCAVIDAPPRDAAQSHGQVGHVDQRINHALKIGFVSRQGECKPIVDYVPTMVLTIDPPQWSQIGPRFLPRSAGRLFFS